MKRKGTFKLSVDTDMVHKRIVAANIGEVITYAELTELIGRDVQGAARYVLHSARNMAMREDRAVFGVNTDVGLVRLDDCAVVDAGADGMAKARRAIRKGARVLGCVNNFDAMPNEKKIQHNTALSLFGALHEAMKPKSVARIEAAVTREAGEIPFAKTLELFAG